MEAMNINSTQYGIITATVSVPAVFMATLTGVVADRVGVLRMLLPLISTVLLGMIIQTFAVYSSSY